MDLRMLSLRQPWAWWICSGAKTIENRTWETGYRGYVLIHASKQWDDGCNTTIDRMDLVEDLNEYIDKNSRFLGWPTPKLLPTDFAAYKTGGVVGRAWLADCIDGNDPRSDNPFWVGPYGFVFEHAEPLPYIPCRGSLGLRKPPEEVLQRLLGRWDKVACKEEQ